MKPFSIAPNSTMKMLPVCRRLGSPRRRLQRLVAGVMSGTLLTLGLGVMPSLAKDPFRTANPRNISDRTESAFRAIFEQGNYLAANNTLQNASPSDPLANAMRASLAYTIQDWDGLRDNASRTRDAAEDLLKTDELRGHLYLATGTFLEGAYILTQSGTVKGAPQALKRLQQVFKHIQAAEKLDSDDPELNMLKGYMDLMLAVNLPFANANQALSRLERYAGPRYLADRGIAVGYRDLGQYDKALDYANRALSATPNNPEVQYLKAQILALRGQKQGTSADFAQASKLFQAALTKSPQLPKYSVWQIFFEACNNQNRVDGRGRDCAALRDTINQKPGVWGPKLDQLPKL